MGDVGVSEGTKLEDCYSHEDNGTEQKQKEGRIVLSVLYNDDDLITIWKKPYCFFN